MTRDGDVFSMGSNKLCVSGHGATANVQTPQLLKSLKDKRVVQISCGESHSLVLTDRGYLYSWGRGFEGQLGLSTNIEIAMIPSFVKFFHEKHVSSIAAGSFYSLAITNDGAMYAWGEARLG